LGLAWQRRGGNVYSIIIIILLLLLLLAVLVDASRASERADE
jgi:uncharacterized integral membrane protein